MATEVKQNGKDPTFNVRELITDAINNVNDISAIRDKHIDEKFKDIDAKYQIQFTAAKEAVGIASTAQEKLVAQALDGTKEAINKADVNTDKRFSLLSEKIDGIMDTMNKNSGERGIYVTHNDLSNEMEKLRNSFENMLRPVVTFMNAQTGKSEGFNMGWIYLIGAISLVGTIISIFHAVSE